MERGGNSISSPSVIRATFCLGRRKGEKSRRASPTAFLMWPSPRPHESFMRQSLSTLLLSSPSSSSSSMDVSLALQDHLSTILPPPPPLSNPADATWRVISQQNLSIWTVFRSTVPSSEYRSFLPRSFSSFLLFSLLAYSRDTWTWDPWLVIIWEEESFTRGVFWKIVAYVRWKVFGWVMYRGDVQNFRAVEYF